MELGYVIAYVADVEATIEWWERAFGLSRRFVAEDGSYGELDDRRDDALVRLA